MPRALDYDDLYRLRLASDPQISPDGERVAFVVTTTDREADENRSNIWVARAGSAEPEQITRGDKDSYPRWSPDGKFLSLLRPGTEGEAPQVWLLPLEGGEAKQVTKFALGATGMEWAHDGDRLLVTAVHDLDGDPADAKELEKRAKAPVVVKQGLFKADGLGLIPSLRVHLHVLDVANGQEEQITKGDLNVSFATWSPDGTRIAFGATDSDREVAGQSHVFVVGATGGEPEGVVQWDGTADVPRWSPDGERLLIVGHERTGSYHARLFLVPSSGGTPEPLAPNFDRNVMVGAPAYPGAPPIWTEQGRILFCARDRGCTHIYAVDEKGGEPKKIVGSEDTVASGLTRAASADRIAYALAGTNHPDDIFVADTDGSGERRLTSLNSELIDELDLHIPEARTFAAPDGTELHGWVIHGDGEGPQPLLLDIHGGPHNAWNPVFDPAHVFHEVLAAKGWSILLLNPRASDGYGEAFFRGAIGNWGIADENDFHSAIDALVEDGAVDGERIAVTGYSYGGYMSNWLAGRSDRFKAVVTGGCVTNKISMYGTADFGGLMGVYEVGKELVEDRDLYAQLSPLSHVENVTAPILILHGEADHRCPVSQAEEWFVTLRRLGRTVEMVRYPGGSHLFIVNGLPSHRIDYSRRVVDWVTRYCAG